MDDHTITYYTSNGATKKKTNCKRQTAPNGLAIFLSYGTIIGYRKVNGDVVYRSDSISVTTSKHRSHMFRYAFPDNVKDAVFTPIADKRLFWERMYMDKILDTFEYRGTQADWNPL